MFDVLMTVDVLFRVVQLESRLLNVAACTYCSNGKFSDKKLIWTNSLVSDEFVLVDSTDIVVQHSVGCRCVDVLMCWCVDDIVSMR